MRRRESGHEQNPEVRTGSVQERGRLEHLAPVFRTLTPPSLEPGATPLTLW